MRPSARAAARTPAGFRWAALLPCLVAACARPAASAPARSPSTPDPRGEDAAALPAFDVPDPAADAPEQGDLSAVPYERYHVVVGDAPVLGPADAPVTIVMFSDFECPFCRRGYETIARLRARYGDRIRVAYKAFPLDFHAHALMAAAAAESARRQGRFWAFHDAMFQRDEVTYEGILEAAEEAGLDVDRVRRDIDGRVGVARVARQIREGRRLGVSSTPTFFINGRKLKGALPFDAFATVVNQELALAARWRKGGVPQDRIYAHAIEEGYRRVTYRRRSRLDPDRIYPVEVGDAPVLGPATAPVTIVLFGDFECPYCAIGRDVLASLRAIYGDRIRIAYKHFPMPFHPHAVPAARGAEYARSKGRFWPYYDAVYAARGRLSPDVLEDIAAKVGLSRRGFRTAMYDDGLDVRILADMDEGRELGIQGTPAFFVNGRPIEGAQDPPAFILIIEEELERARALAAEGVPAERIPAELRSRPLDLAPEAGPASTGGRPAAPPG